MTEASCLQAGKLQGLQLPLSTLIAGCYDKERQKAKRTPAAAVACREWSPHEAGFHMQSTMTRRRWAESSRADDADGCRDGGLASRSLLTLHFERTPLEPSIQTYSAMTLPFCGSLRYFSSCVCC